MRIADYTQDSIVDGSGLRFVLFTQGCPHRCPGCHNPDTQSQDGGRETSVDSIIAEMLGNPLADGVTLSGGEPFAQAAPCSEIARAAHDAGLDVWCYTGYTFEELLASESPEVARLMREIDVLVDGRFVLAERSLTLKWRGSANQRLLDMKKSLEYGTAVLYTVN